MVFDSYLTATWCVIITMTTVGYGDVYAVSPFGRVISIINALWGAFIISLLVASIGKIFELSENQKKAIAEITNSKKAAQSLRASFDYFIAKNDFIKSGPQQKEVLDTGDVPPSKNQLKRLKHKMEVATGHLKQERISNLDMLPRDINAENIDLVKEQVLDLNDKFDFLLSLLMKGQKLGVSLDHTQEVQPAFKEFSLGNVQTSLNQNNDEEEAFDPKNGEHLLKAVKEFEARARHEVGKDRQKFRKPEPKKSLIDRIMEAHKFEEEQGKKKEKEQFLQHLTTGHQIKRQRLSIGVVRNKSLAE